MSDLARPGPGLSSSAAEGTKSLPQGYQDILTRLKAAPEGDRALDCAVALALGTAWTVTRNGGGFYGEYMRGEFGPVTTSMDAALDLLRLKLPDFDWIVGHTNGGLTVHAQVGAHEQCFGETAPLALCVAIIEAVAAEELPTSGAISDAAQTDKQDLGSPQ